MTRLDAGSSQNTGARFDRIVEFVLRWTSIFCMAVLVILVCALVLIRFFPIFSMGWADEVVELAFAWMVFMGTTAVWRGNEHITIDFIPQALAGTRVGRILGVIASLLILGFLGVFTWQGWLLTVQAQSNTTPMLTLPKPLWYATIPVSGLIMMLYTVSGILRPRRPAAPDPEGIKI